MEDNSYLRNYCIRQKWVRDFLAKEPTQTNRINLLSLSSVKQLKKLKNENTCNKNK